MKRLYSSRIALVVLAILGYGTAGRVEAVDVKHDDLQAQHTQLQNQHTNLQNQLNAIQSQLEQIPPAWSQALPAAERFVLVLGGAAVLDKETGLVWEQAPDSESDPADRRTWIDAQRFCNNRSVGGRKGWGLPTIQQLVSLVDPNNPEGDPDLPPGHPFSNVQSSRYWSATTLTTLALDGSTSFAWRVDLSNGDVFNFNKTLNLLVWCVRSGHGGPDVQ